MPHLVCRKSGAEKGGIAAVDRTITWAVAGTATACLSLDQDQHVSCLQPVARWRPPRAGPFDQIWFAQDQGAARFQLSGQLSPPRAGVQRRVSQPDLGQEQGCQEICIAPGRRSTSPNGWNKPLWTTDCSVLSLLFGKRQLGFSLVSKRRKIPISLTCKAQHHGPGRPCERTHTGGAQRADRGSRSLPTDNHLLQALLTSVRQLLAESTFERLRGPSCFTDLHLYPGELSPPHQPGFDRPSLQRLGQPSVAPVSRAGAHAPGRLHQLGAHRSGQVHAQEIPLSPRRGGQPLWLQRCELFCRVFKQKTGLTLPVRALSQPQGQAEGLAG